MSASRGSRATHARVSPARATTPSGALEIAAPTLFVSPGQVLAARVLAARRGTADLSLAGGRVVARTELSLTAGDSLRLVVTEATRETVVLRPAPAPMPAPLAALLDAGLAPATARALLGAALESGLAPRLNHAGTLAARAVAAGVGTPAQAAAFARLAAAGLPTTLGAVAGLAEVMEGPPLGRALASTLALGPRDRAATTVAGTPLPPLATLMAGLASLVRQVEEDAVAGDARRLRAALERLGTDAEAHLAAGRVPDALPVRSLLLAIAAHPDAGPALTQTATRAADALAAQRLAARSLPGASDVDGDAAYLQLPLPGGSTAEARVTPHAGEPEGGVRLALSLRLDALGPVVVDALVGPAGVEATIRVGSAEARRLASARASDLADALRAAGAPTARVQVDGLGEDAPTRLVPPPPPGGLDVAA